jgi:hypothetical protein
MRAKSLSPFSDRQATDPHRSGNVLVGRTGTAMQNDAGPHRQALRALRPASPLFERRALVIGKR